MEEKPKNNHSWWKACLIILGAFVVLFGLYLGVALILRSVYGTSTNSDSKSMPTTFTPSTSGKIDSALVGTWQSECLVPDPESKWAEKHKFVINKDGTATHTRQDWAAADCSATPTGTITDQFKLAIPSSGKINLTYTGVENARLDAAESGKFVNQTIYDIYQVSGNTLEFGHGFRGDNLAYGAKTGGTEATRYDTLNSFIVYKK